MWKSVHHPNYPNKDPALIDIDNGKTSRGKAKGNLKENNTPKTCIGDASRLWNKAPDTIRSAMTLWSAKKRCK